MKKFAIVNGHFCILPFRPANTIRVCSLGYPGYQEAPDIRLTLSKSSELLATSTMLFVYGTKINAEKQPEIAVDVCRVGQAAPIQTI
jgi:hypothetical protein